MGNWQFRPERELTPTPAELVEPDSRRSEYVDPGMMTGLAGIHARHRARNLHLEVNRLKTFDDWKVDFIDKRELAMLGFYHIGADLVQCNFCELRLFDFKPGDSVLQDHIRFSPGCWLLSRGSTDNVAINPAKLAAVLPLVPHYHPEPTNTVSEGAIESLTSEDTHMYMHQMISDMKRMGFDSQR